MKTILETLSIKNPKGLHVRPASEVARFLSQFESCVTFRYNQTSVDASQVMNLLLLEAKCDTLIEVEIKGVDADEVLIGLKELFKSKFGGQN